MKTSQKGLIKVWSDSKGKKKLFWKRFSQENCRQYLNKYPQGLEQLHTHVTLNGTSQVVESKQRA